MTPTVLFHFYATYVNRTIEKLKDLRDETEPKDETKMGTLEKHSMLHDLEMVGNDFQNFELEYEDTLTTSLCTHFQSH